MSDVTVKNKAMHAAAQLKLVDMLPAKTRYSIYDEEITKVKGKINKNTSVQTLLTSKSTITAEKNLKKIFEPIEKDWKTNVRIQVIDLQEKYGDKLPEDVFVISAYDDTRDIIEIDKEKVKMMIETRDKRIARKILEDTAHELFHHRQDKITLNPYFVSSKANPSVTSFEEYMESPEEKTARLFEKEVFT